MWYHMKDNHPFFSPCFPSSKSSVFSQSKSMPKSSRKRIEKSRPISYAPPCFQQRAQTYFYGDGRKWGLYEMKSYVEMAGLRPTPQECPAFAPLTPVYSARSARLNGATPLRMSIEGRFTKPGGLKHIIHSPVWICLVSVNERQPPEWAIANAGHPWGCRGHSPPPFKWAYANAGHSLLFSLKS